MKVRIEFEEGDLDTLHDVVFGLFDKDLSDEELLKIWNKLPEDIHGAAIHWGMDDSVVRDDIHEYLKNNKHIVENE